MVIVPDASLGRERQASLQKTWALLRTLGKVTVLSNKTSQEQLLKHLEENHAQLVLLPWQLYLEWSRVEAYYGLTRTSGPTVAGYFSSPLERHDLGALTHYHRAILLDFSSTRPLERLRLVNSLLHEKFRAGIRPLIGEKAPLFYEDWLGSHPPGATLDSLITLPALRVEPWNTRLAGIQLITLALWNLAFEQGRSLARGNWLTKIHAGKVHARFEIGMDSELLAIRLRYSQSTNHSKVIVREFWPQTENYEAPSDFRQLLLQQSDFLRIHPVSESHEVEIVAGLLRSAPALHRPGDLRTLWIEPLLLQLMAENPAPEGQRQPLLCTYLSDDPNSALAHAKRRIAILENQLCERDSRLQELLDASVAPTDEKKKKSA